MALALGIAGCASTPEPNAALVHARSVVEAAQADPDANKYAALDLEAAKNQLDIAEAAAMRRDEPAIAQPAYLAVQTARLAEARGAAKADDARVAAGQGERDRIQLAARTRDVDAARMAASTANMNANTATMAANAANTAANAANMATNAANMATNEANLAANTAIGQRDAATEQAARLQAEIDQLRATPTPRGLVLTLGDVLFDTGRAQLNPGSARKLDQLAQFLNEHPERRVQIDGFTDSVGSESYNQDLSQRRADAVRFALISRGINPSRIGSQGYGRGFPVADNSDSGGRQLNRRVEVVIGDDSGASIAGRS
jgi:outer membrane protein OmpA-like peptidoglycan-associated protein